MATTLPQLAVPQASATQPTPGYLSQRPAWHRCSEDRPATYECATLKVPLDYERPQGPTIARVLLQAMAFAGRGPVDVRAARVALRREPDAPHGFVVHTTVPIHLQRPHPMSMQESRSG
ncbi:hypothetical protein [Streptomyces sp. NPDC090036]|uniref:hypothetical protein n=1 Tax=Streptomyces sp. NPDC090036 TaxID=3365926 RepID=UPI0038275574